MPRTYTDQWSRGRAFPTKTADSDSIPGRVKAKTLKIWCLQHPYLRFSKKRDTVKPPPCVVEM